MGTFFFNNERDIDIGTSYCMDYILLVPACTNGHIGIGTCNLNVTIAMQKKGREKERGREERERKNSAYLKIIITLVLSYKLLTTCKEILTRGNFMKQDDCERNISRIRENIPWSSKAF